MRSRLDELVRARREARLPAEATERIWANVQRRLVHGPLPDASLAEEPEHPIDTPERLRALCAELRVPDGHAPRVVGDAALHWVLLAIAAAPDPMPALTRLRQVLDGKIVPILADALHAEDRARLLASLPAVWIHAAPTGDAIETVALADEPAAPSPPLLTSVSEQHPHGAAHLSGDLVVELAWAPRGTRLALSGSVDGQLVGSTACVWSGRRLLAHRPMMPRSSDRAGGPELFPFFELRIPRPDDDEDDDDDAP